MKKRVSFPLTRKRECTINAVLTERDLKRFLKEYPSTEAVADEILRQISVRNFACDIKIRFVPYKEVKR